MHYDFLESHVVCINIKSELWHALTFLFPSTNISKTLSILLHKHKPALLRISISREKKTATTTYQPKTGGYRRKTVRIAPFLWKLLKQLKEHTGYSISAIIRIIIEWELEERSGHVPTWKQKVREIGLNYTPNLSCNNYIFLEIWSRGENKEIFVSYYLDDS